MMQRRDCGLNPIHRRGYDAAREPRAFARRVQPVHPLRHQRLPISGQTHRRRRARLHACQQRIRMRKAMQLPIHPPNAELQVLDDEIRQARAQIRRHNARTVGRLHVAKARRGAVVQQILHTLHRRFVPAAAKPERRLLNAPLPHEARQRVIIAKILRTHTHQQRTATAAGASVVEKKQSGKPAVDAVTIGRITDLGIKDANNMGAAMAPAAANTIADFLKDTSSSPSDFDMILTGDLGKVGSRLLCELLQKDRGIDIESVHADCGLLLYDIKKQDVHAGGSGCGCGASVLNSYIMRRLESGELSRVLFVATGALMSPTSSLQGESIPSIAHAVLLSKPT